MRNGFFLFFLALVVLGLCLYVYHRRRKQLIAFLESLGISDVRQGGELEPDLIIGEWGGIPVHILHIEAMDRQIGTISVALGIPNIQQLSIQPRNPESDGSIRALNFQVLGDDKEIAQALVEDPRCRELLSSYIQEPDDRVVIKDCMITAIRRRSTSDFDVLRRTMSEQFNLVQAIRAVMEPYIKIRKDVSTSSSLCPFCRDTLPATYIVECSACKTRYHDLCWTQNNACAVFGCPGTPLRILTAGS